MHGEEESRREVNDPAGELSPELKALEAQLAALRPSSARIDRDRLMFLAGQASPQSPQSPFAPRKWRAFAERKATLRSFAERKATLWSHAAAGAISAAVAVALTVAVWRPAPEVMERIVYRPAAAPSSPEAARETPAASPKPSGPAPSAPAEPAAPLGPRLAVTRDWPALLTFEPGAVRRWQRELREERASLDSPPAERTGRAAAPEPIPTPRSLGKLLEELTEKGLRRSTS
jgi:hypothetical protein